MFACTLTEAQACLQMCMCVLQEHQHDNIRSSEAPLNLQDLHAINSMCTDMQ